MKYVFVLLFIVLCGCQEREGSMFYRQKEMAEFKGEKLVLIAIKTGYLSVYRFKTDSGTYLVTDNGGIVKE